MMSTVAPDEIKNIPEANWEEWCDLFSNGNHGRLVRIVVDAASGKELLVETGSKHAAALKKLARLKSSKNKQHSWL